MSRKLVQTVASMTAKQLRVAVAMLAALALGVGGAAAAVGSLNAATVANDTVATQTVTADDAPTTSATEEAENEAEDETEVAATAQESETEAADEEGTTVESDRNQADCLLPAELLVTKAEAEATAEGDEQTDPADATEADDEAADDTAEVKIWRNHGEFVSSIARNKDLARHAEAVRWAAQSDCGKPMVSADLPEVEESADTNDAQAEEQTAETESRTTKRLAKADNDKRGNGHAKAHGQGNGR